LKMRCLLETAVDTDEFPTNSATLDHRGYTDYKFLSDGRIMGDEAPARCHARGKDEKYALVVI